MIKFRQGDTIKITVGKDKGREGKIERILPKKGAAIVPGVNVYKKHLKGFQNQKGGIYDIPRPLVFAKIALVCPKCKKITRVGFKIIDSKKVRVCRKCGKEIDSK